MRHLSTALPTLTAPLVLAALWLFAGILQAGNGEPKPAENLAGSRPNILFIFSDDHATQAIGAYGSRFGADITPNLDTMAKQGVVFENCICSNPLCGPSRASVLTGMFSNKNHFYSNEAGIPFDGSQPTLPKLLRPAGYQSAMIGKWHLISTPTGFDDFEVLTGQGVYYNPDFITPHGKERISGYTTDILTAHAIDWLKNKRDPKKPFLLMLHHKAPHRDWLPGPDELKLLKGRVWPEPPTLRDTYDGKGKPIKDIRMRISDDMYFAYDLLVNVSPREYLAKEFRTYFDSLTPEQRAGFSSAYDDENAAFLKDPPRGDALLRWKYQRYMTDYLRCVKGVDKSVGEILYYLKSAGLDQNTIVIYSSDQGFFLGEHGWFDKRMPYEESARMPLIMRWPEKLVGGSRLPDIVQNTDFLPTFLDLAGVPIPKSVQGESLVPLLEGAPLPNARDTAYIHFYEDSQEHHAPAYVAVRTQDRLYIRYYARDYIELFDLAKDPLELKNEAQNPAYATDVSRLQKQLDALGKKYEDQTPPWGKQKVPTFGDPLKFAPNPKPALTINDDEVAD